MPTISSQLTPPPLFAGAALTALETAEAVPAVEAVLESRAPQFWEESTSGSLTAACACEAARFTLLCWVLAETAGFLEDTVEDLLEVGFAEDVALEAEEAFEETTEDGLEALLGLPVELLPDSGVGVISGLLDSANAVTENTHMVKRRVHKTARVLLLFFINLTCPLKSVFAYV